ncbi:MAG TPA: GNAT family N-acetyltransferase [Roseiflexaceae bacterium]|nr:GNAT family N-acetyltransferase [Roseiflexaceae bacterium]
MLRLVEPAPNYKAALLEAAGEMHDIGEWDITPADLAARFDDILREQAAAKDPATAPPGVLPYQDFWLLEEDVWIGLLTLRTQINEQFLRSGGHIGYVIRPSRRRRGYGTALLRLGLEQARARGMQRVLLTCAETNLGSRKVIEANGGRLEDILAVEERSARVCRYWIELEPDAA